MKNLVTVFEAERLFHRDSQRFTEVHREIFIEKYINSNKPDVHKSA